MNFSRTLALACFFVFFSPAMACDEIAPVTSRTYTDHGHRLGQLEYLIQSLQQKLQDNPAAVEKFLTTIQPAIDEISADPVLFHNCPINDLPVELLLQIFAQFSPREIVGKVSPVCRQWHMLAKDAAVWAGKPMVFHDFYLYNLLIKSGFCPVIVKIKSTLDRVLRDDHGGANSFFDTPVSSIQDLEIDLLEGSVVFLPDKRVIIKVIKRNFPNLRRLNLKLCGVTSWSQNIRKKKRRYLPAALTSLSLNHITTNDELGFIVEQCPGIKEFALKGLKGIPDIDFELLKPWQLTTLSIIQSPMAHQRDARLNISQISKLFPNLSVLEFSWYCEHILNFDDLPRKLKKLHIFTQEGLNYAYRSALPPSLTTLIISKCSLPYSFLAKVARESPNLEELKIASLMDYNDLMFDMLATFKMLKHVAFDLPGAPRHIPTEVINKYYQNNEFIKKVFYYGQGCYRKCLTTNIEDIPEDETNKLLCP